MNKNRIDIDKNEKDRLGETSGEAASISFIKDKGVAGQCSQNPELKIYVEFKREIPDPVLNIYDAQGGRRLVIPLSENTGAKAVVIGEEKLSHLDSGVYYALLISGEEILEVKRVVIYSKDVYNN